MKYSPIKFGKGRGKEAENKQKVPTESRGATILKLQAQLDLLNDRYSRVILAELPRLRERRETGRSEDKSIVRISDAYYGMLVIKDAKESLSEIETDAELSSVMNQMGNELKILNYLSNGAEQPDASMIRKQIGQMRTRNKKGENPSGSVYKDVDGYVPSDLIDRLLNGESPKSCLKGESLPHNSDTDREFREILEGLSGSEGTSQEAPASGYDDLEELVNALKDN